MQQSRLAFLLEKVDASMASPEELDEISHMISSDTTGELLKVVTAHYEEKQLWRPYEKEMDKTDWELAAAEVLKAAREGFDTDADADTEAAPVMPIRRRYTRIWTAASVLLLAGIGVMTHFLWNKKEKLNQRSGQTAVRDIAPGREGALLTLADGSTLLLDSAGNGQLAAQNGARIILSNGELQYRKESDTSTAIAFNTLQTPKGRQFRLVLPDSSVVWLNAASKIRYPTAFTGVQRAVEVSGEAYFEVMPDSRRPFVVNVNNKTEVEVLGTAFNIKAYPDEHIQYTTLVSGRVRLKATNKQEAELKPGQQAVFGNRLSVGSNVNLAQVMAWKNGSFNFDKLDVVEIMRQLSRWYDVEVEYQGGIPSREYYGEIGRNLTLNQVLEGLQAAGLRCRLENGKKLIVLRD